MDKVERERVALEVVYDPAELDKLVPGDKPDFVLAKRFGPDFGVEVTDLYQTESNARLINVPDYLPQLFAGGPHMHKDDIEVLQVGEFVIQDKDGNVKQDNVRGVFQQRPGRSSYMEKLANLIREKNAKHAGYAPGLSHINLIIVDHFDRSDDDAREYNTVELIGGSVREALAESPFREVFLVGYGPSGKFYYRPLRQLMLMEQFRLFAAAAEAFEQEGGLPVELQVEHVLPLFVREMQNFSFALTYGAENDKEWAFHQGYAVRLEGGGLLISDYADYPPNLEPRDLPECPLPPEVFDAFAAYHHDFVDKFGITTTLWVPAAKWPDWVLARQQDADTE